MSYSTEPFSEMNVDGEVSMVSTWGILLGDNTIICIVDGRLTANMIAERPDDDVMDEYIQDYLPDEEIEVTMVQFNTSTNRYDPII